jgi:uncharacterized protein
MSIRQHAIEVEHHGQTIRGTVYRPDTLKRVPAVLMLHGFTGQRMESGFLFVKLARALAQRGLAAVTFDFRNSGESDGSFENMLATQELDDAVRMTQWLQGQPFADRSRLGLLGFSLGGLLAACTDARTASGGGVYRAMVMIAPTTVDNICRHAGEGAPDPVTIGSHALHRMFFTDVRSLDPIGDIVRHNHRPTLLVQGTGDKAVPPEVSHQYVDAMNKAGVPLTVELISEADHGFSTPAWRAKLIPLVADWLARELG